MQSQTPANWRLFPSISGRSMAGVRGGAEIQGQRMNALWQAHEYWGVLIVPSIRTSKPISEAVCALALIVHVRFLERSISLDAARPSQKCSGPSPRGASISAGNGGCP